MMIPRTCSLALVLSLALPACAIDDGPAGEAPIGEATSAITAGGWSSGASYAGRTYRATQVGYLNGITYTVTVGSCGSWLCGTGEDDHNLKWSSYGADGAWLNGGNVTTGASWQGADSKVSLAAFNGYLYMLHTGADSSSDTYLSRFNPATQLWNQRKIAISSYGGPPSIAAYNGKLYLVGINSSYNIWYATMDTGENFTPQITISGYSSASRVSVTVGYNKLWVAHRAGTTHNIVYNTFDGTSWSGTSYIYGGVDNGVLQGDEPVIAYDANFIRLVHQRPGSGYLWNTTYNGCKWADSETSIGSQSSELPPSLAQSSVGLAMTTEHDVPNVPDYSYDAYVTFYTRPSLVRNCAIGPIDPTL